MRADALRRRQAIITAATELFRLHGPGVSLERIAEAAEVGIATVYRHFPDKQSLVTACTAYLGQEFADFQHQILKEYADGTPGIARAYATHLLDMSLSSLIPAFLPADISGLDEPLAQHREILRAGGEEFIAMARRNGEVGPGVTHLEFVVGILALARPRTVHIEAFEPEIQARMVDLYLAGIRAGHSPSAQN